MADKTPDQEPSIEEILASIRQIISDDDDKDGTVSPSPAPETVKSQQEDRAAFVQPADNAANDVPGSSYGEDRDDEDDDILELTTPVLDEPDTNDDADDIVLEDFDDLDVNDDARPDFSDISVPSFVPAPKIEPEMPVAPVAPKEEVQKPVSKSAMSSFSEDDDILSAAAKNAAINSMSRLTGGMPVNRPREGGGSITVEDLVREMLNPMLRDWLSENLPPMVERLVQKELEKLARQAQDV